MGKIGNCSSCGARRTLRIAKDLHGKRKFICGECWFWEVKKRARINGNVAGKFYPELRNLLP